MWSYIVFLLLLSNGRGQTFRKEESLSSVARGNCHPQSRLHFSGARPFQFHAVVIVVFFSPGADSNEAGISILYLSPVTMMKRPQVQSSFSCRIKEEAQRDSFLTKTSLMYFSGRSQKLVQNARRCGNNVARCKA